MFRAVRQEFLWNICEIIPEFMLHYHICLQHIQHIEFKDTNLYQLNLEYKIFSKFSYPKSFVQFSCPYFKVHLYLSNWSGLTSVPGRDMFFFKLFISNQPTFFILRADVVTKGELCSPQCGGGRSCPVVWPRLSRVDQMVVSALVFCAD